MGRPLKKWPTHALANLERSVDRLKEITAKAEAAEDAIVLGDSVLAMRQLSDVRATAIEIVKDLVLSRAGQYERQETAPLWTQPIEEKATVKAVAQVVATRHQ